MEQPYSGEAHHDSVLVAGVDDIVVTDRAAGLCDVVDAALVGAFNIVAEGEECVGTNGNAAVLVEPSAFGLAGEHFGLHLEIFLPFALRENVHIIVRNVDVDGVVAVGTLDAVNELETKHLR